MVETLAFEVNTIFYICNTIFLVLGLKMYLQSCAIFGSEIHKVFVKWNEWTFHGLCKVVSKNFQTATFLTFPSQFFGFVTLHA